MENDSEASSSDVDNQRRKWALPKSRHIENPSDDEDFEEKRREAWRKRRLVPRKRTNRDNRYIRLKNHENSTTTSSDESSTSTTKNVYYEPIRTKPDLMKYVWNLPQKSLAVFAINDNEKEAYGSEYDALIRSTESESDSI